MLKKYFSKPDFRPNYLFGYIIFFNLDEITIDYVEHIKNVDLRPYYLITWRYEDYSDQNKLHNYILTEEFFQVGSKTIIYFNFNHILIY